jgi:hypothetical protein
MKDQLLRRPRRIHLATLIDERGKVSALCFRSPRAINLKRATWTIRDDAVTCPKCLDKMGKGS